VSRVKEKMSWGVPVPDDDTQVMYVWFDALTNYISTLSWPDDVGNFEKFWGTVHSPNAVQVAGKDQVRFQSIMWQAMLMSAGLPTTKQVVYHGFITSGGQKMSKSVGNVIDPMAIVEEFGADPLRLYLARHIHPFDDSDFTIEKFKESYNADLANGIGNLAARILTLAQANLSDAVTPPNMELPKKYSDALASYNYNAACDHIWERISTLDGRLTSEKPFAVVKTEPEKGKTMIAECIIELHVIARMLSPIIPATSDVILAAIAANEKPSNLFPRKE